MILVLTILKFLNELKKYVAYPLFFLFYSMHSLSITREHLSIQQISTDGEPIFNLYLNVNEQMHQNSKHMITVTNSFKADHTAQLRLRNTHQCVHVHYYISLFVVSQIQLLSNS